jgi:fructokinase
MQLYGGIEAGGTKWNCVVGTGPDDLRAEIRFPTTTPRETLDRAINFFQQHGPLAALGLGVFGPVDLLPDSRTFGQITTTPKPGWAFTDVLGELQRGLGVPVGFDTDVNASALGEHRWGAAQKLQSFIYITIGTGIGGGVMVHGQLVHGVLHPEIGHMLIRHDRTRDPFEGVCPYHGDCLEGMAAGPAIERRWGQRGETLPADHPAWPLEAHYIALGLVNLICTLAPQRIILGGGVVESGVLLPLIRRSVQELLNGYLQIPAIIDAIDEYIVAPGLGNRAGVLGAIALAQAAELA